MTIKTDNLYTGGTSDLDKYVQDTAYGIFKRNLVFDQFGESKTLPQGQYQYQFSIENDMNVDIDNSQLTEGVTPDATNNDFTSVIVTPTQYGKQVKFSDVSLEQDPIDMVEKTSTQLGEKLSRIYDTAIQRSINDGNNVVYKGQTSRSNITSSDNLDFQIISQEATLMANDSVPTINGAYVCLITPKVTYDLFGDTGTSQVGVNQLAQGGSTDVTSEIRGRDLGQYYGVRFIETPNLDAFTGESPTVYPCYLMGQEAYGVVDQGGMSTFLQMPQANDSDPIAQRGFVSGKFKVGADILRQESLRRIEVAASLDS